MNSELDDFLGVQMVGPGAGKPDASPGDTSDAGAEAGEGVDRGGLMDAAAGANLTGEASGAGGADLTGLLGSVLGGAGATDAGEAAGGGGADLTGLLGRLLGGAGGAGASQSATGGLDLGSLLGALLGGGEAGGMQGSNATGSQGSSGLGSLLGALLGGGSASGSSALGQTGLAPVIIQAALPLVLGALAKGTAGRSGQIDLGAASGDDTSADLANRLQSREPLDEDYVRSTGLPEQLAAQTGMDMDSATTAMHKLLSAMQQGGTPDQNR